MQEPADHNDPLLDNRLDDSLDAGFASPPEHEPERISPRYSVHLTRVFVLLANGIFALSVAAYMLGWYDYAEVPMALALAGLLLAIGWLVNGSFEKSLLLALRSVAPYLVLFAANLFRLPGLYYITLVGLPMCGILNLLIVSNYFKNLDDDGPLELED